MIKFIQYGVYTVPTYRFKNPETREIEEHIIKISEYDSFKEANPHLERIIDEAPLFSYSGTGDFGQKKPDDTWNEVLQKIGENNPNSEVANKYVKKTAKEIKTKEVIKKHIDIQTKSTT